MGDLLEHACGFDDGVFKLRGEQCAVGAGLSSSVLYKSQQARAQLRQDAVPPFVDL